MKSAPVATRWGDTGFDVRAHSVWDASADGAEAVKPNLFAGLKVKHQNGVTTLYYTKPGGSTAGNLKYSDVSATRYKVILEAMKK